MDRLDVDVAGNFLDGAQEFQTTWVHCRVPFTEGVVRIYRLEALKATFEDLQVAFDHCAVLEAVDVSGMDVHVAFASFGAWAIASHAFAIFCLLAMRARSNTSSVVF